MFLADSPKCFILFLFYTEFLFCGTMICQWGHEPSYLLCCEIGCLLFLASGSKGNAGARVQQGEIFIVLQHSESGRRMIHSKISRTFLCLVQSNPWPLLCRADDIIASRPSDLLPGYHRTDDWRINWLHHCIYNVVLWNVHLTLKHYFRLGKIVEIAIW